MRRATTSSAGRWSLYAALLGGCALPPAPGSQYRVPAGDVPPAPDAADPTDTSTCSSPQTRCGADCVDTRSDLAHCGTCGNACPSGQVCTAGVCQVTCTAGTTNCGGTCRDTQTDRLHCGACGSACATGQLCAAGRCALSCPAGQMACGATCNTLATDAAHCGACGNACASGQSCAGGVCMGGSGSRTQRSCPTAGALGCGMVSITGGSFTMGEASSAYNASPVQMNVRVSNFALDAYEVTVTRFGVWVVDGQRTPPGPVMYRGGPMAFEGTVNLASDLNPFAECNWNVMGRNDHPINCVNWATAQAFCVWDGNGTGRLPTQAEWEFAARGPSGRVYPWGGASGDTPSNAQACWSGAGMSRSSTCVVGSVPAGDASGGIHDLAGNVWEWNADWYVEYRSMTQGCWANSGPTDPICNDRAMSPSPGYRVVRGGSWDYAGAAYLRAASRSYNTPEGRNNLVGFRCARDTP